MRPNFRERQRLGRGYAGRVRAKMRREDKLRQSSRQTAPRVIGVEECKPSPYAAMLWVMWQNWALVRAFIKHKRWEA